MHINVGIQGLEQLEAKLAELGPNATAALAQALNAEAEQIMARAKDLTPVDKGILKASGHVDPPEVTGNSVSVKLGFGGPASAYALHVHEDLTAHHNVGQAKFLEAPLVEARDGMAERLAEAVKPELGT